MSAGDLGWSRPARISSPSHASIRPRRVAGSRTPAMNSTWSTRHPAVAVEEGMDPQQPMVGGRHRDDPIDSTQLGAAVRGLEASEEARHGAGADRHMTSDPHVPRSELARHDAHPLAGVGVVDPEQVVGQPTTKLAMKRLDERRARGGTSEPRRRRGFRSTAVEHRLDFDVRPRLELERALCRVRGIVGAKRALDVDRVGVVALDEVAVVAVHRPDEGSDFRAHVRVKLCRQPMRLGRQVDGEVFEAASVCAVRGRQHRLHAGDRLTVVTWLALGQHRDCRMQCRIT